MGSSLRIAASLLVIAMLAACSSGGHKRVATGLTTTSGSEASTSTTHKAAAKKKVAAKKVTTTTKAPKRSTATFPPTPAPTFPPAPPPATFPPAPPTTIGGTLGAVRIALRGVASGLNSPVAIAFRPGDSRVYVAEQDGHVRVVSGGVLKTVLTVSVSGGNEQGLLGIAFSNDGTKLYIDFTDPSGNSHVNDYTMHGDVATSGRALLSQTQPFANHNGGEVLVDSAGMLYIGFGDGGSGGDPQGNGQKLSTFLGKILRINPNKNGASPYTIPAGNPFIGHAGARAEIWMYGLRNPWRFSIDHGTHDMWVGDVGQNAYEEVDYAAAGTKGQNWGWNGREGFHAYPGGGSAPGARNPILEETHSDGWCAIIGGYVYRGSAIPLLHGIYLYADNCRTPIVGVVRSGGSIASRREFNLGIGDWTTFGEDAGGEVYVASRNGTIYKIVKG